MADVGWKVATSNVSDVVACGGLPGHALISLGVPEDASATELDALYEGIAEAAKHYGFEVLGGNVTGSDKLMVDCFMTGTAPAFISRGGARAGQVLCVSGTLGDSSAGLEALSSPQNTGEHKTLLSRHLRPLARTDLVPLLREAAGAAIDISDSLASELHHMAAASGVQLAVDGERIPVSKELEAFSASRKEDPRERALFGGEDYQILFSAPKDAIGAGGAKDITIIGEVRQGEGVLLSGRPLPDKGWDHLRNQRRHSP
jgi:thiamine-monophosphate kinase